MDIYIIYNLIQSFDCYVSLLHQEHEFKTQATTMLGDVFSATVREPTTTLVEKPTCLGNPPSHDIPMRCPDWNRLYGKYAYKMAIKWLILNCHWLIRTFRLWPALGRALGPFRSGRHFPGGIVAYLSGSMGLNKMTGGRHEMQLTRQWSRTGRELFGEAEHGDRILTVHLVV